jgi:hypothetical protein
MLPSYLLGNPGTELEVFMNPTGSHWTYEAVQALIALVRKGVPASVISLKLKRPIAEVRAKIDDLGLTPPCGGLSGPARPGLEHRASPPRRA